MSLNVVVQRRHIERTEPDMTKSMPVSVRLQPELNDPIAAIDEGIRAADAGQVVPHEDVAAWVQSWGHPTELPMPKCGL